MFTVKATYRSQTRKLTFPECTFFPSYEELYQQLYRVFPISHNYYLFQLLLSPDSSKPGRILIGKEVHSVQEYNARIAPFQGRVLPNALLRFSVFDETPHKIPSISPSNVSQSWNTSTSTDDQLNPLPDQRRHELSGKSMWIDQLGSGVPQTPGFNANLSPFHIPPPPILFSPSTPFLQPAAMDIDSAPPASSGTASVDDSMYIPSAQPKPTTLKPNVCCAVSAAKTEVQCLLSSFKVDLDAILTKTFSPTLSSPQPLASSWKLQSSNPSTLGGCAYPPPLMIPDNLRTLPCMTHWCVTCQTYFKGPWYTCEKCKFHIICPGCHDRVENRTTFCPVSTTGHVMKKELCALCPDLITPGLYNTQNLGPVNFGSNGDKAPSFFEPAPWATYGNNSLSTLPNAFGGPSVNALSNRSMAPFGSPYGNAIPFIPPPLTESRPGTPHVPETVEPPSGRTITPPPAPIVHKGVVCDECEFTIVGVRHKCLDCLDFDLCTFCMDSGHAERHNPFHEFLGIEEPGRVIVHTVFSGEGERDAQQVAARNNNAVPPQPIHTATPEAEERRPLSVAHNATCDLCDSRIIGNRFKCLDCPDFDTCASCFSITPEQHPKHGFAKIVNIQDYLRSDIVSTVKHYASCNGCNKDILGIRFKCMHPECPDFDLCAGCEAHPIPVHPPNHPMLKMRSPDTVIPTVYRVGQTNVIKHDMPMTEDYQRGRSHSPTPNPRSSYRSYSRGYLRNPARSPSISNRSRSPAFSPSPSPSPSRHRYSINCQHHDFALTPPTCDIGPIIIPPPCFIGGDRSRWSRSCSEASSRPVSPSAQHPLDSFVPALATYAPAEPVIVGIPEIEPDRIPSSTGLGPVASSTASMDTSVAESSGTRFKLPPLSLEPSRDLFWEFWPRVAQELRHLIQEPSSSQDVLQYISAKDKPILESPETTITVKDLQDRDTVAGSPLNSEALLRWPLVLGNGTKMLQNSTAPVMAKNRSLEALLSQSPITASPQNDKEIAPPQPIAQPSNPASASFVSDITVPDGQIFPPGAEFVKAWRVLNDGERDWPDCTELVFAAGESFTRDHDEPEVVKIGSVCAGKEVDLWSGELKAPEAPGKYVGYWRLRDGQGKFFGHSIWIDIYVMELGSHSQESSGSSLACSSIIMPVSAPVASSDVGHDVVNGNDDETSPTSATLITAPSSPQTDGGASDGGSSVSLISIPSSEDEDDSAMWEDSRSHVLVSPERRSGMEYVVLYDDSSSEEE